jgi:hypothetical protein
VDVQKSIEFSIESQAELGAKVDKLVEGAATLLTLVGSQQERFSIHRERLDAHEREMKAHKEEFKAFLDRFDAYLRGRSGNGRGARRGPSRRGYP